MKKNLIPTGYLFVDNYERGQLETLSIGDYGKHHNVKADFLGYSRTIDGVPNTECMPLSEKWVITVSTQYGCRMNCNFCFVTGTQITLANGSRKGIEKIASGDVVLSYDHGKVIENKVVNVQEREFIGEIIEIELEDKTIMQVTGNHPILIKEGPDEKWINAEDLTPNMDVIQVV